MNGHECHVSAQAVPGVPKSKARPLEGGCHDSGRPVSDARSACHLNDSSSSPSGFELRGTKMGAGKIELHILLLPTTERNTEHITCFTEGRVPIGP